MKIIKEGTIEPWIYVFECDNCGCIFEMDYNNPEDMDKMDKSTLAGVEFVRANCPTCHHRIIGFQKEEEDADS
jgi:hypothetical protein